jgi:Flp pilus assembly protein TadD
MSRGFRLLVVVSVLTGSAALAVVLLRLVEGYASLLMLGLGCLVLGVAGTMLHLTLSDDSLRRYFGEPGAAELRRLCRRGWVGVLLGVAFLGMHYFDDWVQATTAEVQFTVALQRGVSAGNAENWQTAVEAFSEAIRLRPNDVRGYRPRGIAYLHLAELDRAVADFDEALRLAPDDARVLYNRGLAYFRKNDYDRALGDIGEAIRLEPSYAKAYRARGGVYRKKGDEVRARADQQKAAELDPALEKPGGGNLF